LGISVKNENAETDYGLEGIKAAQEIIYWEQSDISIMRSCLKKEVKIKISLGQVLIEASRMADQNSKSMD